MTQTNTAPALGFFDLDRIPVVLTYTFTEPATVITFPCKIALETDDSAARQAFYALPEADKITGQHAYYVDLLSRILVAKPTGLPGFDEYVKGRVAAGEAVVAIDWRAAFKSFMSEPSPMKMKVAEQAIDMYNRVIMPVEFFR